MLVSAPSHDASSAWSHAPRRLGPKTCAASLRLGSTPPFPLHPLGLYSSTIVCALPSHGYISCSHWSKGRPISALSQGCRSHAWVRGLPLTRLGPRVASSASNVVCSLAPTPSPSAPLLFFVGLRFSPALPACPLHSPPPTCRGFLLLIPTGKQAIKGQFITLVKQGGIPATFLLSILVLKKRYHTIHYVGCVGVLLGIALVVAPSLADAPVDNWWYIIPLVLSTIPMAGSSVTQEIVLQV